MTVAFLSVAATSTLQSLPPAILIEVITSLPPQPLSGRTNTFESMQSHSTLRVDAENVIYFHFIRSKREQKLRSKMRQRYH